MKRNKPISLSGYFDIQPEPAKPENKYLEAIKAVALVLFVCWPLEVAYFTNEPRLCWFSVGLLFCAACAGGENS